MYIYINMIYLYIYLIYTYTYTYTSDKHIFFLSPSCHTSLSNLIGIHVQTFQDIVAADRLRHRQGPAFGDEVPWSGRIPKSPWYLMTWNWLGWFGYKKKHGWIFGTEYLVPVACRNDPNAWTVRSFFSVVSCKYSPGVLGFPVFQSFLNSLHLFCIHLRQRSMASVDRNAKCVTLRLTFIAFTMGACTLDHRTGMAVSWSQICWYLSIHRQNARKRYLSQLMEAQKLAFWNWRNWMVMNGHEWSILASKAGGFPFRSRCSHGLSQDDGPSIWEIGIHQLQGLDIGGCPSDPDGTVLWLDLYSWIGVRCETIQIMLPQSSYIGV
jgi:hypothetical protein